MSIGNGGKAFPSGSSGGMTLRDYFAAQAMNGLLSLAAQIKTEVGESIATSVAKQSYAAADAMLAARGDV